MAVAVAATAVLAACDAGVATTAGANAAAASKQAEDAKALEEKVRRDIDAATKARQQALDAVDKDGGK
ncbi:MAG TPA: hypothetical protein VMU33_16855 [Burkholderiaceae bacterium]|nr:hypothetical protein [Burkholderiaceae bacterium]